MSTPGAGAQGTKGASPRERVWPARCAERELRAPESDAAAAGRKRRGVA